MSIEIDSHDVIRLMLQFMKENNLNESAKALQKESGVNLNTVDNLETFISDIQHGRWDSVLAQISLVSLPLEKLANLYEQVIFELLEIGERELALELLTKADPLEYLKNEQTSRYEKLVSLCKRQIFNSTDAYEGGLTKEKRRYEIAESLASEVNVVYPSRLLAIINQALKYQQIQGLLPKSNKYDLFSNIKKAVHKDVDERIPSRLAGQIKFTVESHPETAIYSPDGESLVTGSMDGFIEVWNSETLNLRKDLEYQNKDELMLHSTAVLCCIFSKDGEHIATGSQNGELKIWKLSSGNCLKKFPNAHSNGITSITFSKDNTQLLTTSYDQTARIHGLKSGKTIREFRGHTSFVNSGSYSKDYSLVITASSDGTCRIWESKTSEILHTIRPAVLCGNIVREISYHSVLLIPNNTDNIIICSKSSYAYLITIQGQLIKTYYSGKESGTDFMCATISPQGKWLYCVGEDGVLYSFDVLTGKLESTLEVDKREIIGIFHHPFRNLLGMMNDQGQLNIWKP